MSDHTNLRWLTLITGGSHVEDAAFEQIGNDRSLSLTRTKIFRDFPEKFREFPKLSGESLLFVHVKFSVSVSQYSPKTNFVLKRPSRMLRRASTIICTIYILIQSGNKIIT